MTWVGSWVTQTHSTVTSCETNQRLGLALAVVMSTVTLQALRLQLKTQLVDTKDDKDNNFTKNPINKPSGRLQRQIKIWNWRRKWPNLNSCAIKLKHTCNTMFCQPINWQRQQQWAWYSPTATHGRVDATPGRRLPRVVSRICNP